ncbi:MAG: septum formation protein Maf [Planctomycetes bacterium]|nr:septum formation protein Maf [Planctomycetota bacterium]
MILASRSPRRRALLAAHGYTFETAPVAVAEVRPGEQGEPFAAVAENARRKALAAAGAAGPGALVLAADTLLVFEGHSIGKPTDREEAARLLRRLGGATHRVATGVALLGDGVEEVFCEVTAVRLKRLTDAEIRAYHAAIDPLDKAGGYDIDAHGPIAGGVVASIEGSYSNVMGLPMERVAPLLGRCLAGGSAGSARWC